MEQLVMLICCDIPFSPKHFFPHFLFIHVSMAFLKETALLNSTNTGGGVRDGRGGEGLSERRGQGWEETLAFTHSHLSISCFYDGCLRRLLSLACLHLFSVSDCLA